MTRGLQPAIGIDLGTTFSVVARLDDVGRPTTIANAEGDLTTPSVVLVDGDDVVVGKEAQKAAASEPERVAECPKRALGEREFARLVDGRTFAPEVLQGCVLRKLVVDAVRQVGEVRQAVVTVPAYFDEIRRKATQDAAYIAGVELLDIINEPTAAAMAFGYQEGFFTPGRPAAATQRVMVYDLGGGTFDVSVIELSGRSFTTLATDGDAQLGGRDWDERLVNHVAEQFQRQQGMDPRSDPLVLARLWRDCEDAKRTLSARKKATVTCELRGTSLRVDVLREEFEELTRDLVERTRHTVRQALAAAGLDWSGIDRLLLVGGSSRMPMVASMLESLAGRAPDAAVSADEAVAHGAAIWAGLLLAEAQGAPPTIRVRNVNAHSLGVVGTDPHTLRKRNAVLIPRNTGLPSKARRRFRTQRDNQQNILLQVIEGENPSPDACTMIGECVIRDLPRGLPAGTEVELTFAYAANGRLSIDVVVGGQSVNHDIVRPVGLSQAELDQWRLRLADNR